MYLVHILFYCKDICLLPSHVFNTVSYLLLEVCDNSNMPTSEYGRLFCGTKDLQPVVKVLCNQHVQNSCIHCLNMCNMAHCSHVEDLTKQNQNELCIPVIKGKEQLRKCAEYKEL